MSYLTAGLTFDRSAIFAEAWRAARDRRNTARNIHFYHGGAEPQNVRAYFAGALRDVWAAAPREEFQQSTPQQRDQQAQAARAIFGAQMIDSTRRSFAAQDAIRERLSLARAA